MTLEAWVNFPQVLGAENRRDTHLVIKDSPAISSYELSILLFPGERSSGVYFNRGDLVQRCSTNYYVDTFQPNFWSHLAAVYDGTSMKIYVNGRQLELYSYCYPYDTPPSSPNVFYPLKIGVAYDPASASLDFKIDELRISNTARDIALNWRNNIYFSPLGIDSDTVALWRFERNLDDSSMNRNNAVVAYNRVRYVEGPPLPVTLSFSVKTPGIGSGERENRNPQRRERVTNLWILDSNRNQVDAASTTLNFDGNNFVGTAQLGNISQGSYYIKVKLDNSLSKLLNNGQPINITPGTPIATQSATLVMGDTNNDNVINIQDFTRLRQCFASRTTSSNWNECQIADFNDDGRVTITDYSRLVTNFLQRGE